MLVIPLPCLLTRLPTVYASPFRLISCLVLSFTCQAKKCFLFSPCLPTCLPTLAF